MLFGPRLNTVFKSRWNALLWAGCILATAYCSVPSPNADDGERNAAADTAKPVAALFGRGKPAEPETHRNPWTKDGR